MKRVAVVGQEQASVETAAVPAARDNWAVVKVLVAPMCTEYKAFAAGSSQGAYGHEAAGEVVEVAQPGRVKVGNRVVAMPMNACGKCALCLGGDFIHCQDGHDFAAVHGSADGLGTMAQYLLKQDWMLAADPRRHVLRSCLYGLLRLGSHLRRHADYARRPARHGAHHRIGSGRPGRCDQRCVSRRPRYRCRLSRVSHRPGIWS